MLKYYITLCCATSIMASGAIASYDSDDEFLNNESLSPFRNQSQAKSEQAQSTELTIEEAFEFSQNFPREGAALQSKYAIALDQLSRQAQRHQEMHNRSSPDTLKRVFCEMENSLLALRSAQQDAFAFNERAARALRVLGQKTFADQIESKNIANNDQTNAFIQSIQLNLESSKQEFERILNMSAGEDSDEDDDDDKCQSFQCYFEQFQRCLQGEKPDTDASIPDLVACAYYKLKDFTPEALAQKFGKDIVEDLNQRNLEFISSLYGFFLQQLAGVDDEVLIENFEKKTIPLVSAFAKLFKLEVLSEEPDSIRKLMTLILKKIEALD